MVKSLKSGDDVVFEIMDPRRPDLGINYVGRHVARGKLLTVQALRAFAIAMRCWAVVVDRPTALPYLRTTARDFRNTRCLKSHGAGVVFSGTSVDGPVTSVERPGDLHL